MRSCPCFARMPPSLAHAPFPVETSHVPRPPSPPVTHPLSPISLCSAVGQPESLAFSALHEVHKRFARHLLVTGSERAGEHSGVSEGDIIQQASALKHLRWEKAIKFASQERTWEDFMRKWRVLSCMARVILVLFGPPACKAWDAVESNVDRCCVMTPSDKPSLDALMKQWLVPLVESFGPPLRRFRSEGVMPDWASLVHGEAGIKSMTYTHLLVNAKGHGHGRSALTTTWSPLQTSGGYARSAPRPVASARGPPVRTPYPNGWNGRLLVHAFNEQYCGGLPPGTAEADKPCGYKNVFGDCTLDNCPRNDSLTPAGFNRQQWVAATTSTPPSEVLRARAEQSSSRKRMLPSANGAKRANQQHF